MREYVISVGSNVPDGQTNVLRAIDYLRSVLTNVEVSSVYRTDSINGDGTLYCNCVVRGRSDLESAEMEALCKDYETRSGRMRTVKGVVTIDLDVVMVDGVVVRPKDASRYYFTKGFDELS